MESSEGRDIARCSRRWRRWWRRKSSCRWWWRWWSCAEHIVRGVRLGLFGEGRGRWQRIVGWIQFAGRELRRGVALPTQFVWTTGQRWLGWFQCQSQRWSKRLEYVILFERGRRRSRRWLVWGLGLVWWWRWRCRSGRRMGNVARSWSELVEYRTRWRRWRRPSLDDHGNECHLRRRRRWIRWTIGH